MRVRDPIACSICRNKHTFRTSHSKEPFREEKMPAAMPGHGLRGQALGEGKSPSSRQMAYVLTLRARPGRIGEAAVQHLCVGPGWQQPREDRRSDTPLTQTILCQRESISTPRTSGQSTTRSAPPPPPPPSPPYHREILSHNHLSDCSGGILPSHPRMCFTRALAYLRLPPTWLNNLCNALQVIDPEAKFYAGDPRFQRDRRRERDPKRTNHFKKLRVDPQEVYE